MRQDPKDTTEKDDIDRLFARLERDEPPPGSAFKATLEELRQKQAKPVVRRNWARVAQLGLAIAAVLALAIVAVSALILSNNNSNSGSLAANITTVAAITAETTSVTATTTQVLTTAPVTTTTAAQTTVTIERTEVVNAQTPDPTQPVTTASATTTSQPTTAKETSSAPPTAKTPKPLDTPITNTVPTTRPTFLSLGGKVAAYDKGAGIITLSATNGKSVIVKLSSSTVVSKKSTPATTADITVGATLTAEGSYNAQSQLEATAIILDIQSSSQPIGDPGFPNEKS